MLLLEWLSVNTKTLSCHEESLYRPRAKIPKVENFIGKHNMGSFLVPISLSIIALILSLSAVHLITMLAT